MKHAKERLGREYFERLYETSPDPWDFETSEYERKKYCRTIKSLGERKFRRAFDAGCSIGVFTEMLAPKCGELLAVDASERAVSSARERFVNMPNVLVERRTLPEEMPGGTFDLVIASEVLYYLDRATMLETLRLLENSLEPGGLLLAVHWRKETKTYPLLGDEVHDLIRSHTRLRHATSETEPEYRLDLFTREPGRPRIASRESRFEEGGGGTKPPSPKPGRTRRGFAGREGASFREGKVENAPAPDSRRAEPKSATPDTATLDTERA